MFMPNKFSSPLDWFGALVEQNGFMRVASKNQTAWMGDGESWTWLLTKVCLW